MDYQDYYPPLRRGGLSLPPSGPSSGERSLSGPGGDYYRGVSNGGSSTGLRR